MFAGNDWVPLVLSAAALSYWWLLHRAGRFASIILRTVVPAAAAIVVCVGLWCYWADAPQAVAAPVDVVAGSAGGFDLKSTCPPDVAMEAALVDAEAASDGSWGDAAVLVPASRATGLSTQEIGAWFGMFPDTPHADTLREIFNLHDAICAARAVAR